MDLLIYAAIVIILILTALSLYGNFKKHPPSETLPIHGQKFPENFLWSTGEDPYQHEGGNYNTDWAKWENSAPSPIANGDICGECIDFYNRYEEDFDRAKKDFQNAHRIGIEWSRVEPVKGEYDEKAFDHYGKMLASLKRKKFTVLFNLWHFTLPLWAADMGGWDSEEVMDRWKAFVKECSIRYGKYIDYWSTQIDSQIYALSGNALGDIPPNNKDQKLAMRIYRNLIIAHSEAYHIIKEYGKTTRDGETVEPQVGIIYFFFHFEPRSILIDRYITGQIDTIFNWSFLDACHTGTIDIGVRPGPVIKEYNERVEGTLDWIGVNYYTRQIISFTPFKAGFTDLKNYPHYPKSDMDWEIYPEGIYHICRKLDARYNNIPLIIAESGLADEEDTRRPQFIMDHLAYVHKLIEEGVPIFGFTYWSLTDNWEWKEGFWPKFGLYEVDLKTKERKPRQKSVSLFRFIARNNRLPKEDELDKIV